MKKTILSFFPSLTIFLTSLALLFSTAAQGQVPSYVPTNGLVAWWPFSGNANDESGYANNGTVYGSTLTSDRNGNANCAYSFNGSSNYISVPYSPSIGVQQEVSISFWVYFNGGSCSPRIVQSSPWGQCGGYTIFSDSPSNDSRSFYTDFNNCTTGINSPSSPVISALTWHHVVFTASGLTGITNLFFDGTLAQAISTNIFFNSVDYFNHPLTIGNTDPNSCDWFGGFLDDIGIWNRALTADEVLALYNGCNVAPLAVSGNVTPTQFTQETYTYPNTVGSTYNWTVSNGVIVSGQGTNTVNILWASTGLGNVSVVETTTEGCVGTTLSQDVVVIPTNVEELSNAMILYPNPVTTNLTLQVKSEMIGSDFVVYDALGKVVLRDKILSSNQNISVINLSNGNYILRVGEMNKVFNISK